MNCGASNQTLSAEFSVLVPDGVQGVPAVPAEKVQVPEPSGCRHYTEVVSAKQQVYNRLAIFFFFRTVVTTYVAEHIFLLCVCVYVYVFVCVCVWLLV